MPGLGDFGCQALGLTEGVLGIDLVRQPAAVAMRPDKGAHGKRQMVLIDDVGDGARRELIAARPIDADDQGARRTGRVA